MNENKMNKNNDESEQIDNRKQKSQGSIDLDNGVIQLPVSTFNKILERAISNIIFEDKSDEESNIIDQKQLVNKVKNSRYVQIKNQLEIFHSYIQSFAEDLKQIKFIQPHGCLTDSVNVNIKIELTNKLNKDIPHKNSNKELETITISSDSADKPIIKADTPKKIEAISEKKKNINSVDLEIFNDSKKLNVKYKLDQKSKTKVSIRDVEMNLTNKVLPIKTKFDKTLGNEQYLSNTTRKRKLDNEKNWLNTYKIPKIEKSRTTNLSNCQSLAKTVPKPESKSKTIITNNIIPATSKNKKDSEKDWLKNFKIPKIVKPITNTTQKPDPKSETITILSNSISVKKLEVATNNVKLSKYPPPFPPKPPLKIQPTWEEVPPIPKMTVETSGNTVILTWDLNLCLQSSQIKMYELFVCKEIDADSDVSMWKRKGVLKPLMLPMVCEVEIYHLGYTYHFALRAVDIHNRCTGFALQKTKI
ncbi:activating transcription factor 7-interacting protein 2-like [Rhopalosiphum padi]|uniref:activating transcription factor 7-interacting protein 2-like n=1 Tax=Rhopalosiphum padi TaxID=40932 RepID=UPI00298E01C0|nr:activating transcription factor 7-interacting protein 2-like [Rhopalosiphum padi]